MSTPLRHTIYQPKRGKRTKRAYTELFDNPGALFGPNCEVTLYPNGAHEIWIKDQYGNGFRITAGHGKAGHGVTISTIGPKAVARAYDKAYTETRVDTCGEVVLTQYHSDAYSQAFKDWYDKDQTDETREYPTAVPAYHSNGSKVSEGA